MMDARLERKSHERRAARAAARGRRLAHSSSPPAVAPSGGGELRIPTRLHLAVSVDRRARPRESSTAAAHPLVTPVVRTAVRDRHRARPRSRAGPARARRRARARARGRHAARASGSCSPSAGKASSPEASRRAGSVAERAAAVDDRVGELCARLADGIQRAFLEPESALGPLARLAGQPLPLFEPRARATSRLPVFQPSPQPPTERRCSRAPRAGYGEASSTCEFAASSLASGRASPRVTRSARVSWRKPPRTPNATQHATPASAGSRGSSATRIRAPTPPPSRPSSPSPSPPFCRRAGESARVFRRRQRRRANRESRVVHPAVRGGTPRPAQSGCRTLRVRSAHLTSFQNRSIARIPPTLTARDATRS